MASVALLPLSVILVFVFPLSLERYDSSGAGGPFRSCTAESSSCSGPHYVWAAISVLAVVGCVLAPALLGQQAGQHRSKAVGRGISAGVSAAILVAAVVSTVLTHH